MMTVRSLSDNHNPIDPVILKTDGYNYIEHRVTVAWFFGGSNNYSKYSIHILKLLLTRHATNYLIVYPSMQCVKRSSRRKYDLPFSCLCFNTTFTVRWSPTRQSLRWEQGDNHKWTCIFISLLSRQTFKDSFGKCYGKVKVKNWSLHPQFARIFYSNV